MSDLINRYDVYAEIQKSFNKGAINYADGQDLMDRVKQIPTAVVRCRECKWFGEFCDEYKQESRKDGMCDHPKLGRNTVCTVFDFYCADGEWEEQE